MKLDYRITGVDVFVLVWMVEMYFKIIGLTTSTTTVPLLLIMIVWSFYNMYLIHVNKKATSFIYILDVLLAFFTIYGVLAIAIGENIIAKRTGQHINNNSFLLNIYVSLMPIYTFYKYTIDNKLTLKKIYFFTIIFFTVAFFDYQFWLKFAMEKLYNAENREDIINNGSYSIIGLFPLIMLFKKKYIQYIAFAVCSYFIIISFKRGPIVIMLCCYLYYTLFSVNNIIRNKWIVIAIPVAFYFLYDFFITVYADSLYFQERIEETLEGSSSHRDLIASTLLTFFFEHSNLFQVLFGHGAFATIKVAGNAAHNDWLELLVNQGIVCVIIYAVYWLRIIHCWKRNDKSSEQRLAIGTYIIVYLLASFFSMSYSEIPLYATLVLAYVVAKTDHKPVLNLKHE
jgi:hypothetical protein